MVSPSLIMSASAACARCRVCSWRAWACSASRPAPSDDIAVLRSVRRRSRAATRCAARVAAAAGAGGQPGDDGEEIFLDGAVHLGHPLVTVLLRVLDQD